MSESESSVSRSASESESSVSRSESESVSEVSRSESGEIDCPPDGWYTLYMHMSGDLDTFVKIGDTVEPGQQIGVVGKVGGGGLYHLHFAVGEVLLEETELIEYGGGSYPPDELESGNFWGINGFGGSANFSLTDNWDNYGVYPRSSRKNVFGWPQCGLRYADTLGTAPCREARPPGAPPLGYDDMTSFRDNCTRLTPEQINFIRQSLSPPLIGDFTEVRGSTLHKLDAYYAEDYVASQDVSSCTTGTLSPTNARHTKDEPVYVASGGTVDGIKITSKVVDFYPEEGGILIHHTCEGSSSSDSSEESVSEVSRSASESVSEVSRSAFESESVGRSCPPGGWYTEYLHMGADPGFSITSMSVGDVVEKGDIIGSVGERATTGAHLHFTVGEVSSSRNDRARTGLPVVAPNFGEYLLILLTSHHLEYVLMVVRVLQKIYLESLVVLLPTPRILGIRLQILTVKSI